MQRAHERCLRGIGAGGGHRRQTGGPDLQRLHQPGSANVIIGEPAVTTTTPRDTLRRPTVLVCDLVASTAIAEQIGEEPLWELLLEYQDACSEVIHRFDGTVYKRLGDGHLALFGIPRAHENDADARSTRRSPW